MVGRTPGLRCFPVVSRHDAGRPRPARRWGMITWVGRDKSFRVSSSSDELGENRLAVARSSNQGRIARLSGSAVFEAGGLAGSSAQAEPKPRTNNQQLSGLFFFLDHRHQPPSMDIPFEKKK